MHTVFQQSSDAAQRSVESFLAITTTALSSIERLAALNLGVARSVFEHGASGWMASLTAGNTSGMSTLGTIPQPIVDAAIAYPRDVYAIVSETGASLFTLAEQQVAETGKTLARAIDSALEGAPAESAAALGAARTAVGTATLACDSATHMVKQLAEVAHAATVAAMEGSLKAGAALAASSRASH